MFVKSCSIGKLNIMLPISISRRNFSEMDKNNSPPNNKLSNLELQRSYDGIIPRLVTVSNLLDSSMLENFNKTKLDSIIMRKVDTDNVFRQLIAYADLRVIVCTVHCVIANFLFRARCFSNMDLMLKISCKVRSLVWSEC